ncbi:sugar kinase [Priestia filamentosa]|uniref:sugar kinase n=1 Tax=Priestia filamentosa TaxID=1402861 RepID=UPI003983CAA3
MDVISLGETMVLFNPHSTGKMRYCQDFSTKVAGAESNTLIGLSKLGYQTGWISRVGKDELGARILSTLKGEGVGVSFVIRDEESPTGLFLKEKTNERQTKVFYYRKESAASFMSEGDINEEYLSSAKYLYITGITPALSSSCYDSVFHSIKIAKKHGLKVVFDPNLRKTLWGEHEARETLIDVAKEADIILPGISEGEFLFGEQTPEEICSQFHQLGVETVVVKLGEKGAYYSSEGEASYIEGYPVHKVVDPIGAGDGFAAGFLSGLLDHVPLQEAVKRGCAIGAIVVTVEGDIEGLPDKEELYHFMNTITSEDVTR